ncbi:MULTISPECIES: S8 family serine peptidase [unclassified Streptomyces]|uniref:S8 family serine peptidase n=1 Tax=unclassified Streptomyces TaxID=2593676 RepID=UPI00278C440D|nr:MULTISPECIES: S8 family serine peptidase [unclassified Streptomyces]
MNTPTMNTPTSATRRRAAATFAATAALAALTVSGPAATPAAADGADDGTQLASTDCQFGGKVIKGTPWSLQRVITKQLWAHGTGEDIKVGVVDTGTDTVNPQLRGAVAKGKSFVAKSSPTKDEVGHGTKVAGIIAARKTTGKDKGSGFHGMAPGATVVPLQTSTKEAGGNLASMVGAIDYAVKSGIKLINISQGTTADPSQLGPLETAVARAEQADVLIVASAGNSGESGKTSTSYPAALPNSNVLSVAASDRNNERAPFSSPNKEVDIAAPGVDMVSTVPAGGQCVDQGTSFSAPYATGVAALLQQQHPDWKPKHVIWHLESTAMRTHAKHDKNIGWGVLDPVKAVKDTTKPTHQPTNAELQAGTSTGTGEKVTAAKMTLGETPQERNARYGTFLVIGGGLGLAVITAGAMARRDWLRRRGEDVL